MLVLARKLGQQVLINHGSIKIKILKIDKDNITLGFSAPDDIDIDREEIFYKKQIFGVKKLIDAIAA